ncbi:MAG: DNA polymerase/3'-5' exonuclease PolX [Gammaproteobacteria bacterium]|nr:MAG: DNA polymerase/3'-5' exonuclease PolX [Gammaproteobacteria bacterium]
MPVHNADIAAVFDEIADLLEIQGDNPFRIRAYRNAARTLRDMGVEVSELLAQGVDLSRLPGIGKDLAQKIEEVVRTGTLGQLEELRRQVPPGLTELLRLPGLGPKRVQALREHLGIEDLEALRRAAREGRIRELPGFGAKTEQAILQALAQRPAGGEERVLLATATQYAEPLAEHLRRTPGVEQVVIAGSYRRAKETVGDLDILAIAADHQAVMERFTGYDEVARVLSRGTTRSTVILRSGLQVDLRVVGHESFGAALHYFTGSKAHNIAVRRLGVERGLKINEYGVFRGQRRVAGETEDSVFASVGLPFIPPELREDRGEIEAAQEGRLPELVRLEDLRGDLHCHTKATDGRNSLQEMAEAARKLGLSYLAITEHSRRLTVAKGLDPRRLRQHCAAIDRLNEELRGITLLKGIEVDILEDGSLDLPDEALAELDLVVGAVHSKFNLPRKQQTERILRAMDHRYFSILAHPSGRLLGQREPYEVDMERIIEGARQRGCFLELNAHPERLDLNDVYCKMAKEAGVLVSINSDAHSILDLGNLRYGVGQARRGWLEARDVLNTRPLGQLRRLLRRTMG